MGKGRKAEDGEPEDLTVLRQPSCGGVMSFIRDH